MQPSFDHIRDIHVFNCYSVKQFIVQKQTKCLFSTEILRQPKYLSRIENFIVIVLSLNFEVLCKRDVRSRDRVETETLERRDRDETETFEKNASRPSRDRDVRDREP